MSAIFGWIFKKALGTVVSRYVTGFIVTAILATSYGLWQGYKNNLREEGKQQCVTVINHANYVQLANRLAAEQISRAEVQKLYLAQRKVSAKATQRRLEAENKVTELLRDQEEQERNDETYAEWSNTALPDGVADRVRRARATAASTD